MPRKRQGRSLVDELCRMLDSAGLRSVYLEPPPRPPRPLAAHEILAYVLGRLADVKTPPAPQVPPSKPE